MAKRLGDEAAFGQNYHHMVAGEDQVRVIYGMSQRLLLAGMAMQGLLAGKYYNTLVNSPTDRVEDGFPEPIAICKEAFCFVDELLKQEANA